MFWRCAWTTPRSRTAAGTAGRGSTGTFAWWSREPIHVAPLGRVRNHAEGLECDRRSSRCAPSVRTIPGEAGGVTVATTLFDHVGRKSCANWTQGRNSPASRQAEAAQEIAVDQPALWSPQTPALYHACHAVLQERQSCRRGRDAHSDPRARVVGRKRIAAERQAHQACRRQRSPRQWTAWSRGIRSRRGTQSRTAEGGRFNAVRTAHNPPSPAFLDACDRLGPACSG